MTLSEEVISRFNLKRNSYYTESAYGGADEEATLNRRKFNEELESDLRKKWGHKVKPPHYGVSLGSPLPPIFFAAIDYMLDKVNQRCPDFTFSQLKLKFSEVRFYRYGVDEETNKEIDLILHELSDQHLIY